ncbi:C13 family peptidase [Sphingomonas oryzagri]
MSGSITFTPSVQDVIAARRVQFRRRSPSRWSMIHKAIFLALLWLVIYGMNVATGAGWGEAAGMASLFFASMAVPITLLLVLGYSLTGYRVRRLFRQQRALHEEVHANWTDEGLDLRSASASVRMAWSDFHGWRREAPGYLIYVNDYNCHILPHRAFTEEQWADLEDTLVQNGQPRRGVADRTTKALSQEAPAYRAARRRWSIATWSSPGRVALLWIALSSLIIVENLLFGGAGEMVSGALFLSGAPVVAALLAGAVLRLRSMALGLASIFLAIAIVFQAEWLLLQLAAPAGQADELFGILAGAMVLLAILVIALRFAHQRNGRILGAAGLLIATIAVAGWFAQGNPIFYRVAAQTRLALGIGSADQDDEAEKAIDAIRDIPVDRLWGVQPRLVAKQIDGLAPRVAGRSNVYALTVAAGGSQQLFAREARLARDVAAARFGADYRGGVLLSNGVTDILAHTPLATQDNMAAAADGVGDHMDPAHDIAFIYLVSHGSRDAELQTDLPTYDDLSPISAASVADALSHAGIRRRVIIVSACFSGSWIPVLASDDTIVITAARKDRTSFGCDDSLALTYFGEAFLHSPLAKGASLRDTFYAARKAIVAREGADHLTPSEPQVFVGRSMQEIWTQSR